jgi:hypothetical protein
VVGAIHELPLLQGKLKKYYNSNRIAIFAKIFVMVQKIAFAIRFG